MKFRNKILLVFALYAIIAFCALGDLILFGHNKLSGYLFVCSWELGLVFTGMAIGYKLLGNKERSKT